MATKEVCTGAKKKCSTMHKGTRMPKEQVPKCGMAIPSYAEPDLDELQNKMNQLKFTTPKPNSVLRQKQEIENIAALQAPHYTTTSDLTPRTKCAIMPKINQHLNFDASCAVFKNLMPLNVNDSVLLPKEKISLRKKYSTKAANKKPPAPDLADFLDPIEPLIEVIPLPEITLEFPEYKVDPIEIYKRYTEEIVEIDLTAGEG